MRLDSDALTPWVVLRYRYTSLLRLLTDQCCELALVRTIAFVVLFIHGTIGPFMGLIAIHELQHRTVFKTRWLNDFFERSYAFISWSNYIWYQENHAIHHRATYHEEYDGEVLLPTR